MNINMNYLDYYNMFANFLPENKNKNIILEPFSCMVKLILLNYKGIGTKISISNNSINFYEPSQFQGVFRNFNGDGREDLHNLYNPILKSIEWYDSEDSEIYRFMFEKCKCGIEKLIESYDKESTISRTLELYCKMLTDSLSAKNQELTESKKESPIIDTLKDFWKKEEIDLIYSQLRIIETTENEEKETYIKNVINTIDMKEKKLYEFIQKTSTTYGD